MKVACAPMSEASVIRPSSIELTGVPIMSKVVAVTFAGVVVPTSPSIVEVDDKDDCGSEDRGFESSLTGSEADSFV